MFPLMDVSDHRTALALRFVLGFDRPVSSVVRETVAGAEGEWSTGNGWFCLVSPAPGGRHFRCVQKDKSIRFGQ